MKQPLIPKPAYTPAPWHYRGVTREVYSDNHDNYEMGGIDGLNQDYGKDLASANGWLMATAPELDAWVEKLFRREMELPANRRTIDDTEAELILKLLRKSRWPC